MHHAGFYYLKYKIDDPFLYINNSKVKVSCDCYHASVLYSKEKYTDNTFNENFLKCLLKLLPFEYKHIKLNQINFSLLKEIKLEYDSIPQNYGYAYINGEKYKLHNFIVAPLHIFRLPK